MLRFLFASLVVCLIALPVLAQPATLEEQRKQTELLQKILDKIGSTPAPPAVGYETSLVNAWAKETDADKKMGLALADCYGLSTLIADSAALGTFGEFANSLASFEGGFGVAKSLPFLHVAINTERDRQLPFTPDTKLTAEIRGKIKAWVTETSSLVKKIAGGGPPPPPVRPKAVSLTFVVFAATPKTAIVTEDAPFRQWLKDNGIGVYGITTKAQLDANPKFAGVTSPSVVLQDSTNAVIGSVPLTDLASAKDFATQYLGK